VREAQRGVSAQAQPVFDVRACRVCGCTEDDCERCITRTGSPCHWVDYDLCSACETNPVNNHKENSMSKIGEQISEALAKFEEDYSKLAKGNKAAKTRARKALMEIKKIAAAGRKEISDAKHQDQQEAA
jgi:outer membrane murein-binding lipoprotein Lpp